MAVSVKALVCMGNLSYKTYLFISSNFPGLKSQFVVKQRVVQNKFFGDAFSRKKLSKKEVTSNQQTFKIIIIFFVKICFHSYVAWWLWPCAGSLLTEEKIGISA